jgi:hypothetical protein
MLPQDRLVILAKITLGRLNALRNLLGTMTFKNQRGMADPANSLVPFGTHETIHFARFVVLEDHSLNDRAAFGLPRSDEPIYLCFMADCDGLADDLLVRLAAQNLIGLRDIFQHCEGFNGAADMLDWLRERRVKPIASYVNWIGRSVIQAREEERLHNLLRDALPGVQATDPQKILAQLKSLGKPGMLTAAPATPLGWRIENSIHLLLGLLPLIIAAVCLVLFPLLTIPVLCAAVLAFIIVLRRHEQTDPIVDQPYDAQWVALLREREDHDVTNQYTAMGSIKPGRFRRWTEVVILHGIDWVARHICNRGAIGRIGTIHFAHWVFLDERQRGFFCSNYDGGHEAYMDDFINKAGFGLNLSFSSFIGYPITNWLVARGAWLEQDFKRFQRHHQLPTDVWYKAYPGLTARDLARNSRIRNGFERTAMSDDEIRRWLAEI